MVYYDFQHSVSIEALPDQSEASADESLRVSMAHNDFQHSFSISSDITVAEDTTQFPYPGRVCLQAISSRAFLNKHRPQSVRHGFALVNQAQQRPAVTIIDGSISAMLQ